MRPSFRLVLPALTILTWSIEAAYASYPRPAQDIYKRQVRSADYATAPHPSHPNPATPPAADPPSASRAAVSEPAQSSDKAKTKRSFLTGARSQLPRSLSGVPLRAGRIHTRDSRGVHYNDVDYHQRGSKKSGKNISKMDASDPQRKHGHTHGVQLHELNEKGRKSTGRKGVKLHSLKEREGRDISRPSASTKLDTLHIARGTPGIPTTEVHSPDTSSFSKFKPGATSSSPKTGKSASSSPDTSKYLDTSKYIDASKAGNPTQPPDEVTMSFRRPKQFGKNLSPPSVSGPGSR
ncbi:hypothetical protein H0H92_009812 [Tricholoma furcatifolium]|nr:hypothetical protein H0H92_009812 [Tricholoma furcatifolium]